MKFEANLLKLIGVIFFILALTNTTSAHCDSIDGPVVQAAVKTLETGNLNYVFIWIHPEQEAEINEMYNKVVKVRDINPDIRELADMYFYETVVRLHRMTEGVGYTGLKSGNFRPAEGIVAADLAIQENSIKKLLTHVSEKNRDLIRDMFSDLQSKINYNINDVNAGRAYVKSYVHFIHLVEELLNGSSENNAPLSNAHVH